MFTTARCGSREQRPSAHDLRLRQHRLQSAGDRSIGSVITHPGSPATGHSLISGKSAILEAGEAGGPSWKSAMGNGWGMAGSLLFLHNHLVDHHQSSSSCPTTQYRE